MSPSQPLGFLAVPADGEGPGVLVLHAWWGLNDTIRAFCSRLAEEGFLAFAPDLYHGAVAETIPDAESLAAALNADYLQAKSEVANAVAYLLAQTVQTGQELAVIGFSLGAYYALDLSAADPEHIRAVVIFYGSGDADFNASQAAYLGHFAEDDPFEPLENKLWMEERLKHAGRPVAFYDYPETGHWFFEPDRTDAYNPEAARLAWERTLDFLRESFDL